MTDQLSLPPNQSFGGTFGQSLHRPAQWITRWLLFFLISLGLGYASATRYEPRKTAGLTDSALYYSLVSGAEVQGRDIRFRVLVPYVARPFYFLARKIAAPERAVYLALLVANSLFCATTACLLISVALRIAISLPVALLAATLYLLNFAVVNFQLAGMIDAGEACLMMAVTATLFSERWWLLTLCGLLGAIAKETFVPLAAVFALAWWYLDHEKRDDILGKLSPVIAMIMVAITTTIILRLAIAGNISVSGMLEPATDSPAGYLSRVFGAVISRNFWYVFIWLLPLGLLRIERLPRPWVTASILASLVALVLGAYRDIGGNVARPIFALVGPLLSLAAAIFLTGATGLRSQARPSTG